ncbi:MAG: hypothetical protein MZV64_11160 [Ignavibacteriales bacterium]|nr:hypothetical protein [Ignavibacteriales bacterium]
MEGRRRRQHGRDRRDLLEVLRPSTPRRPTSSTPSSTRTGPHRRGDGGPRRRASRATPTSPATTGTTTGRTTTPSTTTTSRPSTAATSIPTAKNVKTSPRTREIALGLEREVTPDLTASAIATFRRSDNFDWAKLFYPADVFPSTPDLVVDGTLGLVRGRRDGPRHDHGRRRHQRRDLRSAWTPAAGPGTCRSASFPGETPYRMVDKTHGVPDLRRPRACRDQAAGQALVHERLRHPPGPARTTGRSHCRSIRPTSGPSTARPTATGAPATTARPRS